MNQRIRELINEATSFKEGLIEGKYDIEVFDKQKFAEMLLNECVINVKDWEKDSRNHISYMLERHFGVEL